MPAHAMQNCPEKKSRSNPARNRQKPFPLKKKHIYNFLKELREEGRSEETVRKYHADLKRYFDFLGEEKWVFSDSLPRWRASMIADGYAARSINASIVAVNSFYDSIGCWEWQCTDWMELKQSEAPELSREEYQLLLREARGRQRIRLYLLIKIFACTELTPSDISGLTLEAVQEGFVCSRKRGKQEKLQLPKVLQEDLLEHATHRNIQSGPIFLNENKKSLPRTQISTQIADLGEDIGLEPGKANPRNLRRLYLSNLAEYEKQARAWIAESYARQLEEEETTIGWRQKAPARKEG